MTPLDRARALLEMTADHMLILPANEFRAICTAYIAAAELIAAIERDHPAQIGYYRAALPNKETDAKVD